LGAAINSFADECSEEDSCRPTDLVRLKMELGATFKPHPLFH
jgi:hypothetical protein